MVYTRPGTELRYWINWQNSRTGKVGMGVSLGGHKYRQEFDGDTPVGDCLNILRGVIVRRASGLDEPEPEKKPPENPDQGSIL